MNIRGWIVLSACTDALVDSEAVSCSVGSGRGRRYLLKLKLAMVSNFQLGIFAHRTDI